MQYRYACPLLLPKSIAQDILLYMRYTALTLVGACHVVTPGEQLNDRRHGTATHAVASVHRPL